MLIFRAQGTGLARWLHVSGMSRTLSAADPNTSFDGLVLQGRRESALGRLDWRQAGLSLLRAFRDAVSGLFSSSSKACGGGP